MLKILFMAYAYLFPIDAFTVKSGDSQDPTVYNIGVVPDSTMNVQIKTGHHLQISQRTVFNRADFQTGSFVDHMNTTAVFILRNQ